MILSSKCTGVLTFENVWKDKGSWPFLEPVDPVALQIPTYFDIIKVSFLLFLILSRSFFFASILVVVGLFCVYVRSLFCCARSFLIPCADLPTFDIVVVGLVCAYVRSRLRVC